MQADPSSILNIGNYKALIRWTKGIIEVTPELVALAKKVWDRLGRTRHICIPPFLVPFSRGKADVFTGWRRDRSDTKDPEDLEGLAGLLCAFTDLSEVEYKLRTLSPLSRPRKGVHFCSVGGPRSNPCSAQIAYLDTISSRLRPSLPFYVDLAPAGPGSVWRWFDGKKHERPWWQIVNGRGLSQHRAGRDSADAGRLTRDFLLISYLPSFLSPKSNDCLIIAGLYGTSVLGIGDLLSNLEILNSIVDETASTNRRYFQSVVAFDNIRKSPDGFSRGKPVHLLTIPLRDDQLEGQIRYARAATATLMSAAQSVNPRIATERKGGRISLRSEPVV